MAEWYNVGTVTWTNNSDIINGTGVAWLTNKVRAGDAIRRPDNVFVEIAEVLDNDSLRLRADYEGPTLTLQAYTILPTASRSIDALDYSLELLDSFGDVRDGIGSGFFPDGTVSNPSFSFFLDRDTGIRRVAANSFAIVNGGVDTAYFDDANNTGLGQTSITTKLDILGDVRLLKSGGSQIYMGDPNFSGSFALRGPGIGATLNGDGIAGELSFYSYNGTNARVQQWVIQGNGIMRPASDNLVNLGTASFRMAQVFAGNGTINTSDEREKTWRSALTEAEILVGRQIVNDELGIFQWNDALAEKGEDGARLHFGARAQRVFALFEAAGLDWRRYAWSCHDEWGAIIEPEMAEVPVTKTRKVSVPTSLIDPETGNPVMAEIDDDYVTVEMQPTGRMITVREAGDRYGIRYDQLTLWLVAVLGADAVQRDARIIEVEQQNVAMAATLAALETRLAALEQAA